MASLFPVQRLQATRIISESCRGNLAEIRFWTRVLDKIQLDDSAARAAEAAYLQTAGDIGAGLFGSMTGGKAEEISFDETQRERLAQVLLNWSNYRAHDLRWLESLLQRLGREVSPFSVESIAAIDLGLRDRFELLLLLKKLACDWETARKLWSLVNPDLILPSDVLSAISFTIFPTGEVVWNMAAEKELDRLDERYGPAHFFFPLEGLRTIERSMEMFNGWQPRQARWVDRFLTRLAEVRPNPPAALEELACPISEVSDTSSTP